MNPSSIPNHARLMWHSHSCQCSCPAPVLLRALRYVRLSLSATMPAGGFMSNSRREFLTKTSLGLIAAAAAPHLDANAQDNAQQLPAGAPPAYGTGPAVGPEVSPATFTEAAKLVR